MKKLFYILLILLVPAVGLATEYVDDNNVCGGNSPCHTTITAAYNAASSGETILVYPGTYQESVTVAKTNLTFQSTEQWAAVMDGNNGSLTYAFYMYSTNAYNTKIIGFKFQNYSVTGPYYGIVSFKYARYGELKYCWFTSNTSDVSENIGYGYFLSGGDYVIRGNKFTGNEG